MLEKQNVENRINFLVIFYLKVIFILLVVHSCSSVSTLNITDLNGFYYNDDEQLYLNIIKKDSFVLKYSNKKSHVQPNMCCEILSFGQVKVDGNYLKLTSSELSSALNTNFDETEDINIDDRMMEFTFNSPISDYNYITYDIGIFSGGNIFLKEIKTTESFISIPKIDNINQIIISIVPNADIPLSNYGIRKLDTFPFAFDIENNKSNSFVFDFPELNFEFVNFKRLNNDYVKIKDRNTLVWDNLEYKRERH